MTIRWMGLGIMMLASTVLAADIETSIRATLIQPWIAAVRANDTARLTRLLHPAVRACVNERTREYFESGTILRPTTVTAGYRIAGLKQWDGPGPLYGLPEDAFAYPVRPTYELSLQFEGSDTVVIRYLALSGGSWFIVVPCPSEKGMALLHEKKAAGEAQKREVARLVAELKDPLLSELRELLRRQRRIDAIKRYQEATGQKDLTLAVMVVRAIAP